MSATLKKNHELFAAEPENTQAFDALVEHYYFNSDDWNELVSLYQHRLTAAPLRENPKLRVPVLFRLAQLLEERCFDLDRAIEFYTEAARLDPTHRPALSHLRKVYTSRGQWEMVLQIADFEAQTEMDPAERAAFYTALGEIWRDQLQDRDEALRCYEQGVEADATNAAALSGLARTLQSLDRGREAVEILERLVQVLDGEARAPALVELGKIVSESLGETERAADYFRRALDCDPRSEDALEALSNSSRAMQQWDVLTDLLERRYDAAAGARRRATIAVEAGHHHLARTHDLSAAALWLERASELCPEDPEVHRHRADLARLIGDDELLRVSLDSLIEHSDGPLAPSILLEAANLQSEQGNERQALEHLTRAQSQSPDDPLVLEALSDTLSSLGRAAELAQVLERRVDLAGEDVETRTATLVELGKVYEEDLDDYEAGVLAFSRAFDAAPETPGVASRLERLYRKAEQWSELRQLLERASTQGPEAKRPSFWASLGELLATQFDDVEGARHSYEAALDLDSTKPRALEGLQRLALSSGDQETVLLAYGREAQVTSDPVRLGFLATEMARLYEADERPEEALHWIQRLIEVSPEDTGALEQAARLHEHLGRTDDLIATLERLDSLLEGAERCAALHRLAEIHAAAGNSDAAIHAWEAAAEIDPNDRTALQALKSQYHIAGRLQELAEVRRRLAEPLTGSERVEELSELVQLLEDQLGDTNGAIYTLGQLAVMSPDCRPPDVAQRLESLLERAGRFEDLAHQLDRRRSRLPAHDSGGLALDLRRARLRIDSLDRYEEAITILHEARTHDPASEELAETLERALRTSCDHQGLADLLEERAGSQNDPSERARIDFERAVLLEDHLEDTTRARALYELLLDGKPEPTVAEGAGTRLQNLLERTGEWTALRSLLEAQIEQQADVDSLALHRRIVELCGEQLQDRQGCIEHLEAMGRIEPSDAETWRQLEAHYDALGQVDDLIRVLETELERSTPPVEPERESSIHARLARIFAGRELEEESAREHYERVLELEPGDGEAAEFLISFHERHHRPVDVLRLLELRLDATPAVEGDGENPRLAIMLRIADLRGGPLDDPRAAIEILERALAEVGPRAVVAEPLATLYEDNSHLDEYLDLCRAAGNAAMSDAERVTWLARLGEGLRTRGSEADQRSAVEIYRQLLELRPGDRDARSALAELHRGLGEAAPLAQLLRAQLDDDPAAEPVAIQLELADLHAGPLGSPQEALTALRCVMEQDPGQPDAFERAVALARELDQPATLRELIDMRLCVDLEPDERGDLLTLHGELLAGSLGQPQEAVAIYREAILLAAEPAPVRRALRELLERLELWAETLDSLYAEAYETTGSERVQLLERAVQIAREHGGDAVLLPWLERMRCERPSDPDLVGQIAELHRRAGRSHALLRSLEDQLELSSEPSLRREIWLETARTLESQLDSPSGAIAALEQARALNSRDSAVLVELDRLYEQTGRQRERVDLLELQLQDLDQPGTQTELALRLEVAELLGDTLGEHARAIPHWLRAVQLASDEDPAKPRQLARLARALGMVNAVEARARAWEAELALLATEDASTTVRRAELHLQLARTYHDQMAARASALQHLRKLVDLLDAAESEAPIHEAIERQEVELLLLHLLRADHSYVELEGQLSARVERGAAAGDDRGPDGTEDWLELARLRDEQLHDWDAAADAYREVLDRDPELTPAIRGLRQLAERLQDWSEVARTLELELATADSAGQRAVLLRRLGDLHLNRLHSDEQARTVYQRAIEELPSDLSSLRALEQITKRQEDWSAALDYYEQEIAALDQSDPARRQRVWLKVGELAREQTDELSRALHAYEQAAELGEDQDACTPLSSTHQREWAELYKRADQIERYVEVMAGWCDAADSPASSFDHLALAAQLARIHQTDAALARARGACDVDPENADAWDEVARLCESLNHPSDAADALARAASIQGGSAARERLMRAAEQVEPEQLERSIDLLRAAVEEDPGSALALARLAEMAERLEAWEEAESCAGRALDIAEDTDLFDEPARLECALVGGRAARQLERLDSAASFFSQALAVEPEHREALEQQGEVLFQRGDITSARHVIEKRLELPGDNPNRAHHLVIVGTGLELGEDWEAALEHFQEALKRDSSLDEAHAGIVRLHEAAGQLDEAIEALDTWAAAVTDPTSRAARWVQAAQLELEDDRSEAAEAHLREATAADPANERARGYLAQLLWDADQTEDALREASEGLEHASSDECRARLALIRGRALELQGDEADAADAYSEAWRCDPCCSEAALGQARLLRAIGEWQAAADALRDFATRYPAPDSRDLAEVYYERGRLMAGPLEDTEEAIRCHEQAVAIEPDFTQAREPLANLLTHFPEKWPRAIEHHRSLLSQQPTRQNSIRALLQIARQQSDSALRTGLTILRSLGLASPDELGEAPVELTLRVGESTQLEGSLDEKLRQVALLASQEIATALAGVDTPPALDWEEPSHAAFWNAKRSAAAELTAPKLAELPEPELASALTALVALALDPTGLADTSIARSMERAVGRWTRRKIRKTLEGVAMEEIAALDFAAWREQLEVVASAVALDRCSGDLRAALTAHLREAGVSTAEQLSESSNLSGILERSSVASRLLQRVVQAWGNEVVQSL